MSGDTLKIDPQARLEDLKIAAAKLSIQVEIADLKYEEIPIRSGLCRVNGQNMILLDKRLPPLKQVEILLDVLKKFDLESIYVASWIREYLENANEEKDKT